MNISRTDFDRFMIHARKLVPSFEVVDGKKQSYLMNLIDGIIYPFNPQFMTRYITTVISKVYFPDGRISQYPKGALEVAGHELVHAYDAKRLTFPLFGSLYLFPVTLFILGLVALGLFVSPAALLPLVATGIHAGVTALTFKLRKFTGFPLILLSLLGAVGLTIADVGWQSLWLGGVSLLLAPLPAPGRAWAELRGYGMSILLEQKLFGRATIEDKVRQFTGPAYYFMMPFVGYIRAKLTQYDSDARAGKLKDPVFLHVQEFFNNLEASRATGEST